jgi:pyruvate formate lyase activating enzyme
MEGIIFDYKHFSTNDGPGIRLTVFLKGCPLRCPWCHNPEGLEHQPETCYRTDILDGQRFDRQVVVGERVSVEKVMNIIEADRMFFEKSGGGVTFSGGEPLMQPQFLLALLKECRKRGIHAAVDTSGFAKLYDFKEVAAYTDLFLFDLKIIDSELHKNTIGADNLLILQNLYYASVSDVPVRIRVPLIPGVTDTVSNIMSIREVVSGMKNVLGIDLLPYHASARSKYQRMNKHCDMVTDTSYSPEKSKHRAEVFRNSFADVTIGG